MYELKNFISYDVVDNSKVFEVLSVFSVYTTSSESIMIP